LTVSGLEANRTWPMKRSVQTLIRRGAGRRRRLAAFDRADSSPCRYAIPHPSGWFPPGASSSAPRGCRTRKTGRGSPGTGSRPSVPRRRTPSSGTLLHYTRAGAPVGDEVPERMGFPRRPIPPGGGYPTGTDFKWGSVWSEGKDCVERNRSERAQVASVASGKAHPRREDLVAGWRPLVAAVYFSVRRYATTSHARAA